MRRAGGKEYGGYGEEYGKGATKRGGSIEEGKAGKFHQPEMPLVHGLTWGSLLTLP